MLDEELMAEIRLDLPEIPVVFISSVVGTGLTELKDRLWEVLNDASNQPTAITHRDMIIPVRTIPEDELNDDEDLMPKTEEYMDEEEVVDPFDYEGDLEDFQE
jgi:GTP-binding protein